MNWFLADNAAAQQSLANANVQLAAQYGTAAGTKLENRNGSWYESDSSTPLYSITEQDKRTLANQIVDEMQANWNAWQNNPTDSNWNTLSEKNIFLAKNLSSLMGGNVHFANGQWWYNNELLFAKKFHTGGGTNLKSNEIASVLQKGEAVLTTGQQDTIANIIAISAKLGQMLKGTHSYRDMFQGIEPTITGAGTTNNSNISIAPAVTVYLEHSGDFDSVAGKKFAADIATATTDSIVDAFSRSGVRTLGGAFLK